MPPARSPRTEPANPEAAIHRDGALTGAAAQDRTGYQTALRALARLLARQAAAEHRASMGDDAPVRIRDAA